MNEPYDRFVAGRGNGVTLAGGDDRAVYKVDFGAPSAFDILTHRSLSASDLSASLHQRGENLVRVEREPFGFGDDHGFVHERASEVAGVRIAFERGYRRAEKSGNGVDRHIDEQFFPQKVVYVLYGVSLDIGGTERSAKTALPATEPIFVAPAPL